MRSLDAADDDDGGLVGMKRMKYKKHMFVELGLFANLSGRVEQKC